MNESADGEMLTSEGLLSRLWDFGTNGIGELATGHVVAGFATEVEARAVETFLATQLVSDVECQPVDAQSWHDPDKRSEVRLPTAGDEISFSLKAGPSFGHGDHETTRLILDVLSHNLSAGDRVLDVGTGSGVLAIAAKLLGAGPTVAIDIDTEAVAVAAANAETNNVAIDVSTTSIDALTDAHANPFDLIVANVLLVAHREVAASVLELLAPGGHLITSGYLPGQSNEVVDIYRPLSVATSLKLGPWVGHVFANSSD